MVLAVSSSRVVPTPSLLVKAQITTSNPDHRRFVATIKGQSAEIIGIIVSTNLRQKWCINFMGWVFQLTKKEGSVTPSPNDRSPDHIQTLAVPQLEEEVQSTQGSRPWNPPYGCSRCSTKSWHHNSVSPCNMRVTKNTIDALPHGKLQTVASCR